MLRLLAAGCSAKQIGLHLSISHRTAEFHKYQMMQALGLENMAELLHFVITHEIFER